eukprot:s1378_g8.t1
MDPNSIKDTPMYNCMQSFGGRVHDYWNPWFCETLPRGGHWPMKSFASFCIWSAFYAQSALVGRLRLN